MATIRTFLRKTRRKLWGLALVAGLVVGCAGSPPPPPPIDTLEEVGVPSGAQAAASLDPDLIIQPGDTLEVIVRRGAGEEKYMTTVLTSGVITVSFQDINVQGLSEVEAETRVAKELTAVIRNPRVQVRIAQKRPVKQRNFYIFGEVKSAGKNALERDATLLHALGQAGGYTDVADLSRVVVISRSKARDGTPIVRVANVDNFFKRGDLSADLPLEDNDVIFIPRDKIGDVNHYISKVIMPVVTTLLATTNATYIAKSLQVLFATPDPAGTSPAIVCWVAQVLYGDHAWQTQVLRWYILGPFSDHWYGRAFADLYKRYGEGTARVLRRHPRLQSLVRPLFDRLLQSAVEAVAAFEAGSERRQAVGVMRR